MPLIRISMVAASLALAAASHAQTDRPSTPPAKASAPRSYASAFSDYRPFADQAPGTWRAGNDRVREAAAKGGTAASTGPAAPSSRPDAQPRAGHEKHPGTGVPK